MFFTNKSTMDINLVCYFYCQFLTANLRHDQRSLICPKPVLFQMISPTNLGHSLLHLIFHFSICRILRWIFSPKTSVKHSSFLVFRMQTIDCAKKGLGGYLWICMFETCVGQPDKTAETSPDPPKTAWEVGFSRFIFVFQTKLLKINAN